MNRGFIILLVLCWTAGAGLAADRALVKFPSPDGRFALRLTHINEDERGDEPGASKLDLRVELIEKATGAVMRKLWRADSNNLADTVLVWSADSKWAAYATRYSPNRIEEGDTTVCFWNGSSFDEVPLPDGLPSPDIKFPKGADAGAKPYGGGVKPLRWLKSGELELSSDDMMLSRGNGRSYRGVVTFTIAFDAEHHATVGNVGKSVTKVGK